uniref:Uncharacterized protein n=1 Tax=Cacopsylla melanoneura TaxID=428564 RepID=A0A8D8QQJ1_9HEMI
MAPAPVMRLVGIVQASAGRIRIVRAVRHAVVDGAECGAHRGRVLDRVGVQRVSIVRKATLYVRQVVALTLTVLQTKPAPADSVETLARRLAVVTGPRVA